MDEARVPRDHTHSLDRPTLRSRPAAQRSSRHVGRALQERLETEEPLGLMRSLRVHLVDGEEREVSADPTVGRAEKDRPTDSR